MSKARPLSIRTRLNWTLDASLFLSAITASITGIYFLFFVSGGYQGGRNPYYDIIILFERHTWDRLHMWTGIAMIAIAIVHFSIHWNWVTSMTARLLRNTFGPGSLNNKARFNVLVDATLGFSFLLTAITGILFLFFPNHNTFAYIIWDIVHTWSGIIMIVAAIIHFAIHWNWIVKVSNKYFLMMTGKIKADYSKENCQKQTI